MKLLLDRLAMANTSELEPLKRGKGGKTESVEQWEQALRTAMLEIEEWCPTFTIILPPKQRERRSKPTRN